MPKFKFTNSDSLPDFIPAGDYKCKVIAAEVGISQGAKTAGSENIKLQLREEESSALIFDTLTFHPSCVTSLDCFTKCMGIEADEGEEVELDPAELIGLRGWVALKVDEWPLNSGNKRNRVRTYLTDRELLDPEFPEESPEDDPFGDDDDIPF